VPVINALTDTFHPLQALADLQTICETFPSNPSAKNSAHKGSLVIPQIKVAWVGDANNILNSLLVSLPRLGIRMSIATPMGYDPPQQILDFARSTAINKGSIALSRSPLEAVQGADVIITDTWVSMGMEADKLKRLKDFEGFKVGCRLWRM
jgi:ornithine carbamoyltransferase